jgi:sulfur carrier protein ThiS
MTATLKVYGPLKSYVQDQSEVSVASGQSVRAALQGLGIPPLLVALVVVNEAPHDKDYILQDGDHVRLTMVLGGG